MMLTYESLMPVDDPQASLDLLTDKFAKIYTESWFAEKAAQHPGKQYNMNVNVFAHMWMQKALRIFLAYDNGQPCGYLIGMMFRPLTHQTTVFQVEDWYAKDKREDIVYGLYDYMQTAADFLSVDELWIAHGANETYPALQSKWKDKGGTMIDCYVR